MTSTIRRPILAACLITLLIAARGVAAQPEPLAAEVASAVDKAVAAEMQHGDLIGVAIGIIQQGRIVYTKGYGYADRERGVPTSVKTVFNWASNSKPLTAVAAMQLVEKGALDLSRDVRDYVPEFPDKGVVITCRDLLCHQSGIPHYTNGKIIPSVREYAAGKRPSDVMVALDRFNQSPVIFKPGEKFSYSSYAYILLSAVVERAGREAFVRQVQERIARPLKMSSLQLDLAKGPQDHWTVRYTKNEQGHVERARPEPEYWKYGAGGFKSDVEDFARWAEGLINHRVVSAKSEELMWQPQPTRDHKQTPYGLGFAIDLKDGLKVSHGGGQPGVATRLVIYPRARHGVVVMCNTTPADPGRISTAVYRALNRRTE
jgi:serine beta-lactamase-like protein LACTB, mitochondrial